MTRYRTIVADPPWEMPSGGPRTNGSWLPGRPSALGYSTMSLDAVSALPIAGLADIDAHLYLWTVNAYIEQAHSVARAWGFRPAQLLVWAKSPRGLGPGGAFATTTEFVLFCRRGSLKAKTRVDRTHWCWKRPYSSRGTIGSAKPDGFFDLVEQVSPGPYVELFARRARFGWDYWGDESLGTAVLAGFSVDAGKPKDTGEFPAPARTQEASDGT